MKSLKGKSLSRSGGTEINKTRLADFIERRKTNVSYVKTETTSLDKDKYGIKFINLKMHCFKNMRPSAVKIVL